MISRIMYERVGMLDEASREIGDGCYDVECCDCPLYEDYSSVADSMCNLLRSKTNIIRP